VDGDAGSGGGIGAGGPAQLRSQAMVASDRRAASGSGVRPEAARHGGQHRAEAAASRGGDATQRSRPRASAHGAMSGGDDGTRVDSEVTPHGGVWQWRYDEKRSVGAQKHCGAHWGGNRHWYEFLTFVGFHHTFVG
jgi:hypothetical protein